MSCRWSHSIPHGDDECLDCEVISLGGPGPYGTPYWTDERCLTHQQLHPLDVCRVATRWRPNSNAFEIFCHTHGKWGKDWVASDVTFAIVQGSAPEFEYFT